jgi:putative transposase
VRPKDKYLVIAELAGQGFSAKLCCRLLRGRPVRVLRVAPAVAHAAGNQDGVADRSGRCGARLVVAVHAKSRGTYGWRRVHAEQVYGHGVIVNRKTIRKIMRTHALHGLAGMTKRFRSKANLATAPDLVQRGFDRPAPNQLWVTDIPEHPTRRQGLLLRDPRCVLPPRRGFVHRQPPSHPTGHQRPGRGHRQPRPRRRGRDGDTQRSRDAR